MESGDVPMIVHGHQVSATAVNLATLPLCPTTLSALLGRSRWWSLSRLQ